MSDDDYIINEEDVQSSKTTKTTTVASDVSRNDNDPSTVTNSMSGTQRGSRRTSSTCSQQSSALDDLLQQFCTTPANYDSGIYTYSNGSDSSFHPNNSSTSTEDESESCHQNSDGRILLSLNEVHKLKSELDRVTKSERWYKNELKLQKRVRLELLERLYLNEHKFIKENQVLKIECDRLSRLYQDLEQKFDEEKESFAKKIHESERFSILTSDRLKSCSSQNLNKSSFDSMVFELQKQNTICKEFEAINDLLRKQKVALLNDLQALTRERDSKTAQLEARNLTLDAENVKITQKCARLTEDNQDLQEKLMQAEELLIKARNDLKQSQVDLKKLKFEYGSQACSIRDQKTEIEELKLLVERQNLKCENFCFPQNPANNSSNILTVQEHKTIMNNVTSPLISQLSEKSNENPVECIPNVLDLQSEISQLKQLRGCDLEALERSKVNLETKEEEINKLHLILKKQLEHIQKLEEEIVEYKQLRENLNKYVELLQENNTELESKQNDIEELESALRMSRLQIKDYSEENIQLRENINELNEILYQKDIENNQNLIELRNVQESLEKVKAEMNNVLTDREKLQKSCKELSSAVDNEILKRSSETDELKRIIKTQSEQISEQKLELAKYQQKCNELCKLLHFERSEFVQQKTEIQEGINMKIEHISKQNSLDSEKIEELENSKNADKEKLSEENSRINSRLKPHRVSINVQLFNQEIFHNSEFDEHVRNIEKLESLLAQKSEKMTILCEEQEKWEKLLENLDAVHQVPSNEPAEKDNTKEEELLQMCCKGCDHLQGEQSKDSLNENLKMKLDEYESLLECKNKEIIHKQDEIIFLEENLVTKEKNIEQLKNDFENVKLEHEKQLQEVKEMHKKSEEILKDELNAKLIEFEIFKPLLTKQDKKLKILEQVLNANEVEKVELEQQLRKMEESVENLLEKVEKLEVEKQKLIDSLKKSQETLQKVPEKCDNECQVELSDNDNDTDEIKNFKIVRKVMESEHSKNISRYELHIRTLLGNIKSYKKNLETVEGRYEKLKERCKELEGKENKAKLGREKEDEINDREQEEKEHLSDGEITAKCQKCTEIATKFTENAQKLNEVERRYEESEMIVETLKHQLEIARKQFLQIDDYRRANKDLKISLTNLMDDYKGVLQSLLSSERKSTIGSTYTEIMDLIEASNNFVPNFNTLSTSIDDMKNDLKRFKNNFAVGGVSNSTRRSVSLLDELREAEALNLK